MDSYAISMNISAEEYALQRVDEFKSTFYTTSLASSNSHSN
jgi:hypothetical protein